MAVVSGRSGFYLGFSGGFSYLAEEQCREFVVVFFFFLCCFFYFIFAKGFKKKKIGLCRKTKTESFEIKIIHGSD